MWVLLVRENMNGISFVYPFGVCFYLNRFFVTVFCKRIAVLGFAASTEVLLMAMMRGTSQQTHRGEDVFKIVHNTPKKFEKRKRKKKKKNRKINKVPFNERNPSSQKQKRRRRIKKAISHDQAILFLVFGLVL